MKLLYLLIVLSLPSRGTLLFHEGFEKKTFSENFNSICGGCIHNGKDKIALTYKDARDGIRSLSITQHKGRTELATKRFPLAQDLIIKWSLFVPLDFDTSSSATVTQFIGWQAPCFNGGNFHIRIEQGRWSVWMRNIGKSSKDIILNKFVDKGNWTDLIVKAKFTQSVGYFELAIKDTSSFQHFMLINSGQSFINCTLGPYIKFGLYGENGEGNRIKLDKISVEEIK
ncbi:MAG: hypothetical protein ACI9VT_001352 [Psychroserpens sp.]|jgi:hypothetical protein